MNEYDEVWRPHGQHDAPFRWWKPRMVRIGVDLFHPDVPDDFIAEVFAVMALADRHTFQVLTKRPERMRDLMGSTKWLLTHYAVKLHHHAPNSGVADMVFATFPLSNVWLGVSVEDQATADERIPILLDTPAALRFVSYEPALGPVDFGWLSRRTHVLKSLAGYIHHQDGSLQTTTGLDWIIVGGESGPDARPFDVQWARDTIQQCRAVGVPVFVKQLGALPFQGEVHRQGEHRTFRSRLVLGIKHRSGANPDEWPDDLRVREYPEVAS